MQLKQLGSNDLQRESVREEEKSKAPVKEP